MMFKGISSLDELIRISEDSGIENKKDSIAQIIQIIENNYKRGKLYEIEDKESTLNSTSYSKLIEELKKAYEDPSEENIKKLTKELNLTNEADQSLKGILFKGEGNAEDVANLLASDIIDLSDSKGEGEVSGRNLGKSVEWPHPVIEGSLHDAWIKMAEDKRVPILEKLIDFFKKNPAPDDDEIHSFAEDSNIDPHELEEEIYSLVGALIGKGRSNLSKNKNKDFNEDQKDKGIEVEQEHFEGSDLPQEIIDLLAGKISEDHQSEGPLFNKEYYNGLLDMEDELKKN